MRLEPVPPAPVLLLGAKYELAPADNDRRHPGRRAGAVACPVHVVGDFRQQPLEHEFDGLLLAVEFGGDGRHVAREVADADVQRPAAGAEPALHVPQPRDGRVEVGGHRQRRLRGRQVFHLFLVLRALKRARGDFPDADAEQAYRFAAGPGVAALELVQQRLRADVVAVILGFQQPVGLHHARLRDLRGDADIVRVSGRQLAGEVACPVRVVDGNGVLECQQPDLAQAVVNGLADLVPPAAFAHRPLARVLAPVIVKAKGRGEHFFGRVELLGRGPRPGGPGAERLHDEQVVGRLQRDVLEVFDLRRVVEGDADRRANAPFGGDLLNAEHRGQRFAPADRDGPDVCRYTLDRHSVERVRVLRV